MKDWKQKLKMRLPALMLLAATLLFWGRYDRYERTGVPLIESPALNREAGIRFRGDTTESNGIYRLHVPSANQVASVNMSLPPSFDSSKYLRVRGRIRVDGIVAGKYPWRCARLLLIQYDAQEQWISGHHGIIALDGTAGWEAAEDVFEVDERTVRADLVIQQLGTAGTAYFDQLVVEPVALRASFIGWQTGFAILWAVLAILYFRRCRLHRRKLRILILLNVLAIIVGTLMPEKWIENTSRLAKHEMEKVQAAAAESTPRPASTSKGSEPGGLLDDLGRFSTTVGGMHGLGHYGLFASLCFLVYLSAALERQHRSYFLKVAFDILLFAAITESLQFLTIDRTPGVLDWLIDLAGMITALLVFLLVGFVLCPKLARRLPVT